MRCHSRRGLSCHLIVTQTDLATATLCEVFYSGREFQTLMKRRDYRHSRVRPRGAEYTLFLAAVLLSLSIARIPAQSPENQCDSQWRIVKAVDVADQDGDFDALNAVAAVSSTDVWAVGQWERFASKHSYNQPLIEHWNGKSWIRVPSPKPRLPIAQLNGVSALSSNDVWAVGYQEGLLGSPYYGYWSLIEHWDGNQWTIVDDASQVGYLTSVCAIAPDDVWAVGSTNYIGYGILSHWNGKTWSRTYIFDAIFLRSVTAINGHDVWAVGQQAHNGSGDYSNIAWYGWSCYRPVRCHAGSRPHPRVGRRDHP